MQRLVVIPDPKPIYSEWFVEVDLSNWLAGENIQTVVFSAKKLSDGTDATTEVLDVSKNTNTTSVIKPFIRGGTSGEWYIVTLQVETDAGSKDEFYIKFQVRNVY